MLGKIFVANEAPKFSEVFKDCDYKTPMVFVLSSGSDPLQSLQRYADEVGKKLRAISLGQRNICSYSRSGGNRKKGNPRVQEFRGVDSPPELPSVKELHART